MGDPIRLKKKYKRPFSIWEKERIDEEKELTKEYGLKNKKEIWKSRSILDSIKKQAKKLQTLSTDQARKEEKQLMERLISYGLINAGDPLDKILGLNLKNILDRRLQTVVYRMGLANTVDQARQFIVHHHVTVNNRKITSPAHMVLKKDEPSITFSEASSLNNPDHPEIAKTRVLTPEEKEVLAKKKDSEAKKRSNKPEKKYNKQYKKERTNTKEKKEEAKAE